MPGRYAWKSWAPEGATACPLAWLDSFCMRSFTGREAFDETLPVADGEMEVSFQVDTNSSVHRYGRLADEEIWRGKAC